MKIEATNGYLVVHPADALFGYKTQIGYNMLKQRADREGLKLLCIPTNLMEWDQANVIELERQLAEAKPSMPISYFR
jgi:hypothetical protein